MPLDTKDEVIIQLELQLEILAIAADRLVNFAWSGVTVSWDNGNTRSSEAEAYLQSNINKVREVLKNFELPNSKDDKIKCT